MLFSRVSLHNKDLSRFGRLCRLAEVLNRLDACANKRPFHSVLLTCGDPVPAASSCNLFTSFFFRVVEQTASLTDQFEEPLPGMMVLGMGLEVLGQVLDAVGKQGNLHLRRPSIGWMGFELSL
jgi:hypothetical protein